MQTKHLVLAILVTAVWGLNFPITKLGLAHVDPLLLTAIRFTFAALPWVFFIKRPNIAVRWLVAYGLIFGVAMWALINLGIAMGVPPGSAALLIQFSAFFTLGWGVILFRESITRAQLAGILLATVGLLTVVLTSTSQATTIGLALVVVSAVAWSIGNIIIKLSKVKEIFAFVVWASLFPPIPLALLTWWWKGAMPFSTLGAHINIMTIFSLAFQTYAATHFCYWGWNVLLREYPASTVAPLSLLIPVFATISAMFIVNQTPSLSDWLCLVMILSALAIGMKKSSPVLRAKNRSMS